MITIQPKKVLLALAFVFAAFCVTAQTAINKQSFNIINLNYPGLEKVKKDVDAGAYDKAAAKLLQYFRTRTNIKNAPYNKQEVAQLRDKKPAAADLEKADNALEHKFQPQKGYGFYDYGKDINWQYWPVKDNEVRWQLHRVYWWEPMGRVYAATADEKYAKEWILQFRDWAKKNPLGLSADNDRFAWRALEVSERVKSLPGTFNLFINSPSFTPQFLMEFLSSFNQQADYIPKNYSELGNHLLFEAQRILGAGAYFPEFKNSPEWRKSGIDVINTEIKKQVFEDGVQWELSPSYHVASVNIFLNAYLAAEQAGLEKELLPNFKNIIEKMIMATINFSFPDYNNPMYGDSWLVEKKGRVKQFADWSKSFPDNPYILYFATDGKKGKQPDWLSYALKDAGFYTFRNGWNNQSTVLMLKASQPAAFHAQPDNGTFELWVKDRNFMPDAGCYVYSGDAEIMKQREWYRQTRVHNTLTLDNENMVITKAHLDKWEVDKNPEILTYTNPSYENLNHQRSVLFIDQKYFLIIDKAIGKATGNLGVHFVLKEDSKPMFDKAANKVFTNYADGNNLLIQSLNKDKITLSEEDGKVSYIYRKEMPRPAFVFEKPKADAGTQSFVSIVYPYEGANAPQISITENPGNNYTTGAIDVTLTINGVQKKVVVGL